MKVETCYYSGYKIHPGHGKRVVRVDGKVHIFLSKKACQGWKLRRNPRKVTWTVLYRRKHKKGVQAEEVTKRKTRKTVKHQRAVGNTPLEALLAKRNQKPEFRKQQRDSAIKAAKEKSRATATAKKVEKKASAKSGGVKAPQAKTAKAGGGGKAAPRVGGKR